MSSEISIYVNDKLVSKIIDNLHFWVTYAVYHHYDFKIIFK